VHIDLRYEGDRFEDDLNSRPLDEAFTVDVRVDYQVTDHVSIYGAVDNLFDAEVQTRLTSVYEYGPPQLWRIGLAYRR
jgi:outer membrane cobalamin receptor